MMKVNTWWNLMATVRRSGHFDAHMGATVSGTGGPNFAKRSAAVSFSAFTTNSNCWHTSCDMRMVFSYSTKCPSVISAMYSSAVLTCKDTQLSKNTHTHVYKQSKSDIIFIT
jgi:hypothetical protein